MFFTAPDIKLWIEQRWINDMERMEKNPNICFTCNKTGPLDKDKEKQTAKSVFVYVDPYSHELKISPTMGPAKEFQHLKFVGALKSFCNENK